MSIFLLTEIEATQVLTRRIEDLGGVERAALSVDTESFELSACLPALWLFWSLFCSAQNGFLWLKQKLLETVPLGT